jgi:hypothetical protein
VEASSIRDSENDILLNGSASALGLLATHRPLREAVSRLVYGEHVSSWRWHSPVDADEPNPTC